MNTKQKMAKFDIGIDVSKEKWGYLKENKNKIKEGEVDDDIGLRFNGLDEYLEVLFPDYTWIYNQRLYYYDDNKEKRYIIPDYRCGELKLVVEFDGILHYTDHNTILRDANNERIYDKMGYTVIRIPYFIQLTNDVVNTLFKQYSNVLSVNETLFNPNISSMYGECKGFGPAYTCASGFKRMVKVLKQFPQQFELLVKSLKRFVADGSVNGVDLLEEEYNRFRSDEIDKH